MSSIRQLPAIRSASYQDVILHQCLRLKYHWYQYEIEAPYDLGTNTVQRGYDANQMSSFLHRGANGGS